SRHLELHHEDSLAVRRCEELLERRDVGILEAVAILRSEVERLELGDRMARHASGASRESVDREIVDNHELTVARPLTIHLDAVEMRVHGHPRPDERIVRCVIAKSAMAEDQRLRAAMDGTDVFGFIKKKPRATERECSRDGERDAKP